jgi:hypothetical protein
MLAIPGWGGGIETFQLNMLATPWWGGGIETFQLNMIVIHEKI